VKRGLVVGFQRRVLNPAVRFAARRGLLPKTHALLETTGRKSGEPRLNPVGNGLSDDRRTFWLVAEQGRHAQYVKNLMAEPRVRVRVGKDWFEGRAQVLADDDPVARLKKIGGTVNGLFVRMVGTDLLTVRIDLDEGPETGSRG